MDPGTIIAVVETSFSVLSLIAKYYSGIQKAKEDIEGLNTEVEAFYNGFREIRKLVRSSHATKLLLLASLATTIERSLSDIETIKTKLNPGTGDKVMHRTGLRALQWPFTKEKVEEYIAKLERHKTTVALALSSDQTALILGIDRNVSQLQQKQNLADQDQNLAEQDRQLGKLLVADGAAFDSYYRQHEPQCVQNTRVDLLRQVQTWSNSDDLKCIFWLNGMAGTGKSTIARTVARAFADQQHLGASFFFSRGAGDLSHATKFVSTLACQLAGLSSLFKRHISQAIADHDNITRQGLRNQWKELILKPLLMLNRPDLTLTFVVDALDECEREEDVKLILELFVEIKDLVGLKIFLTSRTETPIRLGFQDMPEIFHRDLVLHDIPRPLVEHDIGVFLRYELDSIKKNRDLHDDWLDDKSINLLVKRSDCLFIYIATVCRFIGDSKWRPQERLSLILEGETTGLQLTADLDSMYMQILKHSVISIASERDISQLSKRFKHIIGSIITLFDVLSPIALAGLLNVSLEDVRLTLDSLHSVLKVQKEHNLSIRLLHSSFQDFLVDNERCDDTRFHINQELVHMELANACLQLLCRTLKRDICNLHMPGALRHETLSSQIDDHLSKEVQYACRYWVHHLKRIDPEKRIQIGLHDDGQIHTFFLEHVLHWFEALSLLGKIHEGVAMIIRLEAMLQFDKQSALQAIIYDAKRFIFNNRSTIENAPLQLYASALVFCPKHSLIRAVYSNELPTWITKYPKVKDNWSSLLQVLHHTEFVNAVAFSSDDQLLASASVDLTVRLWDPVTGTLRNTLEGHTKSITAVAFSGDGQLLASGSDDQTIKLWDSATGTLRCTLEGHATSIAAVAFSNNDQYLASASWEDRIQVWDPARGTLVRTFEGHTTKTTAVAFSGDGQLLASGSEDRLIKLWNLATGMLRRTLDDDKNTSTAVAFSADGQLLASASYGQAVRLWDLGTGTLRATFENPTKPTALAFSGNGQLLACACVDQTIRLWNPATGTLQYTLAGHTGDITAVAFSGDSRVLASSSWDRTVRLWDLGTETLQNTPATEMLQSMPEGHTDEIHTVVFSHDGKLLASASEDRTIRLWNPLTGKLRSKLAPEGHTDTINEVAFSSDDQLLASGYEDSTIRLWDPATGTLRSTLEGHTDGIMAMAFSGNGQYLASGSRDDQTIRLWDPATGTLRSTLEGHTDGIIAVAFSGNGQYLASASWDQTIRLWDPATGTLRSTLEGHTEGISALVFSGDSHLLASAAWGEKLRLWDPATGNLVQLFEAEGVAELLFSADRTQLETNVGRIQLSNDACGQSLRSGHWTLQGNWLAWDNHNVLWLPSEYGPSCFAIRGNLLVLGHFSGQVDFVELQPSFFSYLSTT